MFFLGVFHGVRKFGFQLGSSSGVGPDRRPWSKPTSKQTRKDRSKPNLRKSVGFRGTAWVFEVFLCFLLCDLIQLFCWEEQVTEQSKKKKEEEDVNCAVEKPAGACFGRASRQISLRGVCGDKLDQLL